MPEIPEIPEIKDEAKRAGRVLGRGRDEGTPFYLQGTVLLAVGAVAGIIVAIVFIAQALA